MITEENVVPLRLSQWGMHQEKHNERRITMEKVPINTPEDLTNTASADMTITDSQEAHDVAQSALSHNPAQLMSESGTDTETGNEDEQTEILQAVREGNALLERRTAPAADDVCSAELSWDEDSHEWSWRCPYCNRPTTALDKHVVLMLCPEVEDMSRIRSWCMSFLSGYALSRHQCSSCRNIVAIGFAMSQKEQFINQAISPMD
ncbi:MAG: hypothetical protein PUF97_01025 [Bifidobacteriaceae bacterium]|nr:hypothetical protein [Bifidobacteriaceae bacterium]